MKWATSRARENAAQCSMIRHALICSISRSLNPRMRINQFFAISSSCDGKIRSPRQDAARVAMPDRVMARFGCWMGQFRGCYRGSQGRGAMDTAPERRHTDGAGNKIVIGSTRMPANVPACGGLVIAQPVATVAVRSTRRRCGSPPCWSVHGSARCATRRHAPCSSRCS